MTTRLLEPIDIDELSDKTFLIKRLDCIDVQSLMKECDEITLKSNYMKPAGMGGSKGYDALSDSSYRGDENCFISPDLCEELSLSYTKAFIKFLIEELKILKESNKYIESLSLNGDFSVQLSIFVSHVYPLLYK